MSCMDHGHLTLTPLVDKTPTYRPCCNKDTHQNASLPAMKRLMLIYLTLFDNTSVLFNLYPFKSVIGAKQKGLVTVQ